MSVDDLRELVQEHEGDDKAWFIASTEEYPPQVEGAEEDVFDAIKFVYGPERY
jgi:hypothetical protein